MSKYEEYVKEVEKLEGKDKFFATLLLDIRYVLNSIDKQMKGKTQVKKPE